jgi:F-type H+-transporting ATPase subunit alpha
MEEEVVSVWSGTTGKLDDVPLEDVRRFEREFLDHLKRDRVEILDSIRSSSDLSDDSVRLLEDAVGEFKTQFLTSGGTPLIVNEPAAEALDEAEVQHATITRVRG